MTRRVFVSDTHMGLGASLTKDAKDPATAREYDWCDLDEAAQFLFFLQHLLNEDIQEVILLGDIMDVWAYPHDVEAPSYSDIAAAAHVRPIIKAIDDLSKKKNVTVTYIPGNHDMDVMDEGDQAIRDFRGKVPRVKFTPGPYQTKDGIYAEHGHNYLMWNAVDPDHSLPVGYYITRLLASISAYTTGMTYTIPQVVRALKKSALVDDPLTFLAEQLKGAGEHAVRDNTMIPKLGKTGIPLTLREIKKVYRDLPDRWRRSHGDILEPWESVGYEVGGLLDVARDLVRKPKRQVVILGHTHKEEICLIGPAAQISGHEEYYGIYANCGSWCYYNNTNPEPYSWVETESDGNRHTVSLMHWDWRRRRAVVEKKEYFPPSTGKPVA